MVVDTQPIELAVQCGPTDAKCARRSRNIAVAQGQGASDSAFLGLQEVGLCRAGEQDFRGRELAGNSLVSNGQRQPCRPRGPDDEVVAIHGQKHGCVPFCGISGEDYAGVREMLAKGLGFYGAGGISDSSSDEAQDTSGRIGPAGRDVQKTCQAAMRIMYRMAGTGHGRIAGVEVLVAVNRDGTVFGKGRANPVGTFCGLGPVSARPEAPAPECLVVGRGSPPFHGDPVSVAEQYAASGIPNCEEEPVQDRLGCPGHGLHCLTGFVQLFGRHDGRTTPSLGVKPMQGHGTSPGRRNGRARSICAVVQKTTNPVSVVMLRPVAHAFTPWFVIENQ